MRALLSLLLVLGACGDDDSNANLDGGIDAPPGADGPSLHCPDPTAAWDWPLPQGPVTVTPDASWKHDVAFAGDPFLSAYSGSGGSETRWIKFSVLLRDPTRVYFQHSTDYPFHYDFAVAKLDPFRGMTRAEFDAVSLHEAGQEVVLGVVLFPPRSGLPEYGIQLIGQDPYHPELVRRVVELVSAHVAAPDGTRAVYMPTTEQARCRASYQSWLEERGLLVDDPGRWLLHNACYAPGWSIGRLTEVAGPAIDAAYLAGTLLPSDILLTDAVPAEVPYLAGILTTEPSTPNSHVAILSRSYGVPFVYLRDDALADRARALVGREIVVATTPVWWSGGCDVRLIDMTSVDPAVREMIRAMGQPRPVAYPPKTPAGTPTRSVDDLGPADVATVGGKAAHFGLLRDAIPASSPEAVALTIDVWDAFMAQPHSGGGTLGEHIAASLAPFTWPPDFAALDAELARIRGLIEAAEFPAALRPGIEAGLAGFDEGVRLRFRSSTNVEDGETFTGAGLYDSVTGCLADDTDGDTVGPSRCDASKPDERGAYRAIRKVYASFYARNAYLERLRRGVDPAEVGMGVLVHHSFPDDLELANGVATLGRNYSTHYVIAAQLGAVSVTNPDGSALPEVVDADVYEFGRYLYPREASSLVPLGAHVMAWEQDYLDLLGLLELVSARYAQVRGMTVYSLDFEFKKVQDGGLVVKQVRPLPQPDTTRDVVPFLVGETTPLCTFQGEYGDVWANHRLKTRWVATAEHRWMSNLATSFWSNAEIDRVQAGSIVHLSGRPSTFGGASHSVAGEVVTDAFSVPGGTWALGTQIIPLVQRNQAPVVLPGDFFHHLTATYATPVPAIDWTGPTTRTEDTVMLSALCLDSQVLTGEHIRVDRSFVGPGGMQVTTAYYWPPNPGGIGAGYTAPLVKWEQTTITGLASAPIVLASDWSQTYRPAHHNFGAEYIFEPRLEPGLSPAILAELAAADIQLLYLSEAYGGAAEIWAQGLDGALRRLQ